MLALDLNMPGGSSLGAIPTLRETSPTTGIVCRKSTPDKRLHRVEHDGGHVIQPSPSDEGATP